MLNENESILRDAVGNGKRVTLIACYDATRCKQVSSRLDVEYFADPELNFSQSYYIGDHYLNATRAFSTWSKITTWSPTV